MLALVIGAGGVLVNDESLLQPSPPSWDDVSWLGAHNTSTYKTSFDVPSDAKSCTLFAIGLGYSSLSVNGKPAPSEVLHLVTSPWTNNERINAYASVELSGPVLGLKLGASNTVGFSLGVGWRDPIFTRKDKDFPGDMVERVLRAQVHCDGKVVTKTGDATWLALTSQSPVLSSSVYDGEVFDARIKDPLAGDADAAIWAPATALEPSACPHGKMVPWLSPPVAVTATVKPVKITNPRPDTFVVDFGSNLAGVVELVGAVCARGSNITLKHAEIMQHSGIPGLDHPDTKMVYTANLRSAKATDIYTCSGQPGGESWFPRLTYHGFRFVEIDAPADSGFVPTASNVRMLHFHTAAVQRSNFNSTSDTFNTLQKMAVGAQRSNLMTVPTDCDQRDERLGWMGDANLSGDSMLLNFDLVAFFKDFVVNMRSELDAADGSLTDTVPWTRFGGRPGDVSWTAAFPNIVHALWKTTGDTGVISEQLPALVAHLRNVQEQAKGGLAAMHTPYGDWCPPPTKMGGGQGPKPSQAYTSAFSYLDMVRKLRAMSSAVGNTTLAEEMASLFTSLSLEFNDAFAHKKDSTTPGGYDNNCQTALVLALELGVTPNSSATSAALVASLKENSMHYSTGIIGFKFLFDVLAKAGEEEAAATVLSQLDYPSIGFYFANSQEKATENLWELPDALAEGTGMNSRNHHMWSSFSHFLVKSIGGLDVSYATASGPSVGTTATLGASFSTSYSSTSAKALFLPCNTLLVAGANVSTDGASMRWKRTGGIQADKVVSGRRATLDCGGARGGTIREVLFASYGTPQHDGPALTNWKKAPSGCHCNRSQEVVERLCVGEASCFVPANSDTFAGNKLAADATDDCCFDDHTAEVSTPTQLWLQVLCSEPAALEVEVTVPRHFSGGGLITLPLYNVVPTAAEYVIEHRRNGDSGNATQELIDLVNVAALPEGVMSVRQKKDHAGRQVIDVSMVPGTSHYFRLTGAAH